MALQILALVLITALLLLPAARVLRFVRNGARKTDPMLKDASRQLADEILVLILIVAFLAVAFSMHIGPF